MRSCIPWGAAGCSFADLISYLNTETEPGQAVTLHVLRDGDPRTFQVTLSTRPEQEQATAPRRISMNQAIQIAKETLAASKSLTRVESASDLQAGQPVWIAQVEGQDKHASVVVDAHTGDVVSTDVEEK